MMDSIVSITYDFMGVNGYVLRVYIFKFKLIIFKLGERLGIQDRRKK